MQRLQRSNELIALALRTGAIDSDDAKIAESGWNDDYETLVRQCICSVLKKPPRVAGELGLRRDGGRCRIVACTPRISSGP